MRILAIGDIHGCLVALETLLAAVEPRPEDLIVTLGDYVDRGPDTRGVIDRLLELDETHQLVPLRGNHELMMLDARASDFDFWMSIGGRETLESYGGEGESGLDRVPKEHWDFIERRCVEWHETEGYVFAHAGVNPDLPMEEQDEYDLFWQKLLPSMARRHVSGKTVICGHTAQPSGQPLHLGYTVCIDTWVYGAGWLTGLDLESGRIWQANQSGELRESLLEDFLQA